MYEDVSMKSKKTKLLSYEEYLNTLTKKELTSILQTLEMSYNAKVKVSDLISLILNELDEVVVKLLSFFTKEEYKKIKYIIKKGGTVKIRTDVILMEFCQMLTNRHLMYKIEDRKYILFKELYKIFKTKIKQKKVINKCQKNSEELHLILGSTHVYGAIDFTRFYQIYSEKYQIPENELKDYLLSLSKYSNAFKTFTTKDKLYIANKKIKNIKDCKKYADAKDIKEYSLKEIQELYTLKYMKKYKSYNKLKKFITGSYYIEKDNFSVVVQKVLNPFIEEYQININKANDMLNKLIDNYFEYSTEKLKTKFINLANDFVKDYPRWTLNGYSEREKEK